MSDYELMNLIKQSDNQAFKLLYNRYWKALYSFAFSFFNDESLAQDIVQEIWIKFWELRKNIENKNIKSLLYKMVRNRVYNELRNNKKFVHQLNQIDDYFSVNNTKDIIDLEDTNRKLHDCINRLPQRNKEIFIMSRLKEISNSDISIKLGISKRTVENYISGSLKFIRENAVIFLVVFSIFQ